jgi:hypothetical protein
MDSEKLTINYSGPCDASLAGGIGNAHATRLRCIPGPRTPRKTRQNVRYVCLCTEQSHKGRSPVLFSTVAAITYQPQNFSGIPGERQNARSPNLCHNRSKPISSLTYVPLQRLVRRGPPVAQVRDLLKRSDSLLECFYHRCFPPSLQATDRGRSYASRPERSCPPFVQSHDASRGSLRRTPVWICLMFPLS